jgi:hypothetical protein
MLKRALLSFAQVLRSSGRQRLFPRFEGQRDARTQQTSPRTVRFICLPIVPAVLTTEQLPPPLQQALSCLVLATSIVRQLWW